MLAVAITAALPVALLAESVDRNAKQNYTMLDNLKVALLAESVDRNGSDKWQEIMGIKSLSSRRAWIEIALH